MKDAEISMKKRILYGVANYEEIVAKNGYFIDKTQYIERLEEIENPVFLRPPAVWQVPVVQDSGMLLQHSSERPVRRAVRQYMDREQSNPAKKRIYCSSS